MRRGSRAVALLVTLLAPAVAAAGVVIQLQQPGGRTIYMAEGKKLRIESEAEQGRIMIFDGDARKLFELDPRAGTYAEITEADAKAVASQIDAMIGRLPPEQRAQAKANLKQRKKRLESLPEVAYEPTGGREAVAGFSCLGYRVVRDGKVSQQGCFIPWNASPVKKEDLRALVEFGNFMDRFMSTAWGANDRRSGLSIADQITRAPGFPAMIEHIADDGRKESVEWLVSIARADLPADAFTVPEGYRKLEVPASGGGGPQRPKR